MGGMGLGSHRHTSKSLLKTEYDYCVRKEVGARQRICALTVEYYLTSTDKEYREIEFKNPDDAADTDEIIVFNVFNRKKIDGYFDPTRTANLPDELSHFIAWAIDKLYNKNIASQLRELCFPTPAKSRTNSLPLIRLLKNCNNEHAEHMDAAFELAGGDITKIPVETIQMARREALESIEADEEYVAALDEELGARSLKAAS